MMTVRQWFRLARAAAWEKERLFPDIQIIFRAPSWEWRSPYCPAIPLYTFVDMERLIAAALVGDLSALETVEMRIRRDMHSVSFFMRDIVNACPP